LIVGCCAFVVPARAHADPTATNLAGELTAIGDRLFETNRFEAALHAYEAAQSIDPGPPSALLVAKGLYGMGRWVEAHATLRSAASTPFAAGEAARVTQARTEAKRAAERLATRIPTLRIIVRGPEEEVDAIEIDGIKRASRASVNPGTHVVSVRVGSSVVERVVNVREGTNAEVTMTLGPSVAHGVANRLIAAELESRK
jgi:hypothetical protein